MSLYHPPEPPRHPAPRPLDVVQAAIVANYEAQQQALAEHRPDRVAVLQSEQRALYLERDRARFATRGIVPQIIRGEP